MITALYSITSFAPFYYHIHIFKDGEYTGQGHFCADQNELAQVCRYYKVQELKRI